MANPKMQSLLDSTPMLVQPKRRHETRYEVKIELVKMNIEVQ